MEAFSMQNPNYHSGIPFEPFSENHANGHASPSKSDRSGRMEQMRRPSAADRKPVTAAAGLADGYGSSGSGAEGTSRTFQDAKGREKQINAILAETAVHRKSAAGKRKTDICPGASDSGNRAGAAVTGQKSASKAKRRADITQSPNGKRSDAVNAGLQGRKKKKKKKKRSTLTKILKCYIPWPGDSVADAFRKIVFFVALCVVGICTFLISHYYIGLYHDKQAYRELQKTLEDNRNNAPSEPVIRYDPDSDDYYEYFDHMNELGVLLKQNPDLVGHIKIEGTPVDYPVVQKRSSDPNRNTNDYYLKRNFAQEQSDSGCIFMDFRCVFDRVVDHMRILKNSENLIVYGHNMNNKTMFGSLRDYTRSPLYYKEHPIVELQSLYKTYYYKIFSVFVVDGTDFTSPYAFDCWNTIDFSDEDEFYEYVNNAKKRNLISNDVDVVYGDPILTLYTCNSMITSEGKLILMCRLIREDEKGNEKIGTETAELNENVLYPEVYYKNHDQTFDISKFVPYGPKKQNTDSVTNSN